MTVARGVWVAGASLVVAAVVSSCGGASPSQRVAQAPRGAYAGGEAVPAQPEGARGPSGDAARGAPGDRDAVYGGAAAGGAVGGGGAVPNDRVPAPQVAPRAPSVDDSVRPARPLQPTRPEPTIDQWQSRIDQALAALSSAGGECRDICRASDDICLAAREICDLTGDTHAASPGDARCARARTSCDQATRQRATACPVCPSR